MKLQYRRIAAGLLLVLLDFRIGYFDLLPDAIGYWLIAGALRVLASTNKDYNKAFPYAILLGVLTLTEWLPVWSSDSGFEPVIAKMVYDSVTALLLLLLLDRFLVALERHAARSLLTAGLADSARNRRIGYLVTGSVMLVMTPFTLNAGPELAVWAVVVSIILFIMLISIYFLCRRAAKSDWPGHDLGL